MMCLLTKKNIFGCAPIVDVVLALDVPLQVVPFVDADLLITCQSDENALILIPACSVSSRADYSLRASSGSPCNTSRQGSVQRDGWMDGWMDGQRMWDYLSTDGHGERLGRLLLVVPVQLLGLDRRRRHANDADYDLLHPGATMKTIKSTRATM
ncbi:hypothetical protein SEVIR_4G064101v4 [Setaria viridis]